MFDVIMSSALTSPLPFTENCRRHRCRQPRSWRKLNTKFKLCKQVWHRFCDLFQGIRWEVRGQGSLGVSGLSVKQLLEGREVQQSSNVLCESEQTLLWQPVIGKYRDKAMEHTRNQSISGITAGCGTYHPIVFWFHTFPNG